MWTSMMRGRLKSYLTPLCYTALGEAECTTNWCLCRAQSWEAIDTLQYAPWHHDALHHTSASTTADELYLRVRIWRSVHCPSQT